VKLRVFEIDAIASKVIESIKNSLTIPDYSKEVKERNFLYNEFLSLLSKENEWKKKREDFGKEHSFTIPSTWNGITHYFTPESYKEQLENKYLNSKLPNRKDIDNEVILSGNKDLSELVDELIKKYASKN
jgi:hypothetical protein